MSDQEKSSTGKVILIIVLVLGGGALLIGGIMAVLAIYGARTYLTRAKQAEGPHYAAGLAAGIVACAASEGLPASSPSVPAALSAVSGKKYQSTSADWGDPTFVCARFVLSTPQYFQYRWERTSDTGGAVHALADLDGDGAADSTVRIDVSCTSKTACVASPPVISGAGRP